MKSEEKEKKKDIIKIHLWGRICRGSALWEQILPYI